MALSGVTSSYLTFVSQGIRLIKESDQEYGVPTPNMDRDTRRGIVSIEIEVSIKI